MSLCDADLGGWSLDSAALVRGNLPLASMRRVTDSTPLAGKQKSPISKQSSPQPGNGTNPTHTATPQQPDFFLGPSGKMECSSQVLGG